MWEGVAVRARSLIMLGGLGAILYALVAVYMSGDPPPEPDARPERWVEHPVGMGATPSSAASGGSTPLPGLPPKMGVPSANFAEMRRLFETSQNYRAFVSQALERPADGGRFYALMAMETCIRAQALQHTRRKAPEGDSGQGSEQSALALDQLDQRCQGLAEQFGGLRNLYSRVLAKAPAGSDDPLLRAQRQLTNESGDPWEAVQRARALSDPNLLAMAVAAKAEQLLARAKPFGDSPLDEDLVMRAAVTAGCEIRGDCINGLDNLTECAANACSSLDLRERVLAGIEDPKERDQYLKLRQWLLNAMK